MRALAPFPSDQESTAAVPDVLEAQPLRNGLQTLENLEFVVRQLFIDKNFSFWHISGRLRAKCVGF